MIWYLKKKKHQGIYILKNEKEMTVKVEILALERGWRFSFAKI